MGQIELLDLAYVAGIIDGEGSIMLGKPKGYVTPKVSVCNTYLPLLTNLRVQFGGNISPVSNIGNPLARKARYIWSVDGVRALDFLESVCPLLLEKQDRALLVLEFGQKTDYRHKRKLNDETKRQRLDFLYKLRSLVRGSGASLEAPLA